MCYLVGDRNQPEGMKVSLASERLADHHFVVTLVNAWRSGALIVVPPPEEDFLAIHPDDRKGCHE